MLGWDTRSYRPAALKVFSKNPRGACRYHVTTLPRHSLFYTLHSQIPLSSPPRAVILTDPEGAQRIEGERRDLASNPLPFAACRGVVSA